MPAVDRNVLRLGVWELLCDRGRPRQPSRSARRWRWSTEPVRPTSRRSSSTASSVPWSATRRPWSDLALTAPHARATTEGPRGGPGRHRNRTGGEALANGAAKDGLEVVVVDRHLVGGRVPVLRVHPDQDDGARQRRGREVRRAATLAWATRRSSSSLGAGRAAHRRGRDDALGRHDRGGPAQGRRRHGPPRRRPADRDRHGGGRDRRRDHPGAPTRPARRRAEHPARGPPSRPSRGSPTRRTGPTATPSASPRCPGRWSWPAAARSAASSRRCSRALARPASR